MQNIFIGTRGFFMKIFFLTIGLAFCLSIGHGVNAQKAHSEEKTLKETGRKMETSPDIKKAPSDLQYIDTMTLHHRAAISMAELALTNSNNTQIKTISQKIITTQNAEIANMQTIRANLYPAAPKAENMEMKGMKTSIEDMDVGNLKAAKGDDFDKLYIQMMTTHHQGGITMAKEKLTDKTSDKRLKQLSKNVITEQTGEIEQLKNIYRNVE
jgi:uncharacterized protein (DUF305 family)